MPKSAQNGSTRSFVASWTCPQTCDKNGHFSNFVKFSHTGVAQITQICQFSHWMQFNPNFCQNQPKMDKRKVLSCLEHVRKRVTKMDTFQISWNFPIPGWFNFLQICALKYVRCSNRALQGIFYFRYMINVSFSFCLFLNTGLFSLLKLNTWLSSLLK